MLRRKETLEEKVSALIRAEFAGILAELDRDRREYRRRLRLKGEARETLGEAEARVQKLYAGRIELKKRFWKAYYEEDEAALFKVSSEQRLLERTIKRAEKTLQKARAKFKRADFDEVAEGFALKTKANIAEDEVARRLQALEKTLEEAIAEVRGAAGEVSQALRDEYKEPEFDTAEEQNAHARKMIEVLGAVAEGYDLQREKAVSAPEENTVTAASMRQPWDRGYPGIGVGPAREAPSRIGLCVHLARKYGERAMTIILEAARRPIT